MNSKSDKISILLWIFVLFIIGIFSYLYTINSHLKQYSTYHNSIAKLEILNKNLDNFLLKKSNFINYDNINKDIKEFEVNIEILNSTNTKNNFNKKYLIYLKKVKNDFAKKANIIEHFKSTNAQLVDSFHYLYDLNYAISESKTIPKDKIKLINQLYLHIIKYYINSTIDIREIKKNLLYLKDYIKHKPSLEIEFFVNHALVNLKYISNFENITKFSSIDTLETNIIQLHHFIDKDYKNKHEEETKIVILIFVFILLTLFVLIFSYKKSLKIKAELFGFKTAIENSYNSVIMTDTDSNIVYVNDTVIKETGYSKDELMGQNPRVLKSGLNDEILYEDMHYKINNAKKWEGVFINKRKDDSLYHEKVSIMPIFIDDKLVNYLAIKLNITDYIEEKEKVEYMAYHDYLTKLPNRLNIENYLENRLKVAKRQNTKIAILFIDLDRFKGINDTLGHSVGDELLIEVASRLKQSLRKSDMLSRFGGDEFIVVIDGMDDNYSAAYVCEKILKLFALPIQTKQHQLNITLSIGISIFPDDAQNSTKLFKYADIAMYKAKNAGKNTYRHYKIELSKDVHNRFNMEQALKYGMDNDEFYMVYQPQYTLSDKTILGLEALVRWESKSLGFVGPDKFIPVCEDVGYIIDLGLFIFKQACIDFLIFSKISTTLETISINISAIQLYQNKFIDNIIDIIDEVGIQTQSIMIEITETHIMKNVIYSMNILQKLKKLGFKISIDDFGTGHSSLSYLKKFPISELKIDKSFVDNLPTDKDDVSIVKAILAISSSMEYINVAEGIENIEQEKFLQENDCKIGQGYYFSKPLKKDNLINFFNS